MCGICGYMSKKALTEELLAKMNDTMVHRGPDDRGVVLLEDRGWNIGLAHRRLSILDLSPLGHQPMTGASGNTTIVFNGEIYNFLQLKDVLLAEGYNFHTTCDTEVVLAAYAHWGSDCVSHFNGMFAFVIYDREKGTAFGARDRFGKKPFYYYHTEQEFVFASELKPLMAYPNFKKKINQEILGRYLHQGYIVCPDSIFESTFKLSPGHRFTWADNQLEVSCYWNPVTANEAKSQELIKDFKSAKAKLSGALEQAVERRMISDVPLGTFLSGGIDSTLVTAFAQKISKLPVKTYTIGFEDKKYDEAIFAKEIARHLGTDHHEACLTEDIMLDLVDSIPHYYDEPFGDSSQIPTMFVSKIARQDITVALSGDGGDELFCGYNSYDKLMLAHRLDLLGGLVYPLAKIPAFAKLLPTSVRTIACNRSAKTKTQLLASSRRESIASLLKNSYLDIRYPIEDKFPLKNWQLRRMLLDMQTYLPGDILTKVDRASMKYSLESRCPLLDYEVAELSFRIPHEFKCNGGDKKYILKEIAYDFVPKALLDRPKKGFSVPVAKWLKGPLRERFEYFTSPGFVENQGLFRYAGVSRMKADFLADPLELGEVSHIWNFLIFQMWYDVYMNKPWQQ
ncbi:MAG: asparagine synthase (glutamine-hydrolyzing) [Desulfosporosinus sp.]|nr:asparagine synthase (glutamine-hydrolyzing) [Desulfosporosinus sp.]